ncbi:Vitamin B12 transporter BtuB [Sinobacterium norvegicum]|uniref:Vitamin B12 transporter BtuB n=1 Tax=Sinobacterium norvegicum TaxID=1641715 RepID=A0ABM9AF06_9GAMM|nr:TonB-dependent receptor [Sinobacterium norvegicum]CAH0991788.1 Vitamin B12 transporter BtuB [Sinobacterium norvegicum]
MMKMFNKKPIAMLIASTSLLAGAAQAQTETVLALEEVVVTAQKRSESLQDTPIAISAFNSTALENLGVTDVTDLGSSIPSVTMAPFPSSTSTPVIYIRGIGTTDIQTTKDGAVGMYIDGVYVGRANGMASDVADIERIEVLRGPQGTLYGRNTTGGAINFITEKPHEEFALTQTFNAANYDSFGSKTSINVPLTDDLFAKFSYMTSQKDGWIESEGDGVTSDNEPSIGWGDEDKEAANLSVRWHMTDTLTARRIIRMWRSMTVAMKKQI